MALATLFDLYGVYVHQYHVFMVGSDSRALPLLLFYAGSQTIVFLLITYRIIALQQAR